MSTPTSLRASAARGVFWMAMQIWFTRLATVGAFVILSRQLQPSEFGLIALAMAVISVLNLFGDSGIATYVVRVEKVTQPLLSTAFWSTFAISGLLAAALAALGSPIAAIFDEPELAPVLRWLSLSLLLYGLGGIPTAMLKRDMRFRELAVRGTVATIVGSVVAIVLALAGFGVWALVAQTLVRAVIALVIIWASARWLPSLLWDRRLFREMISFGSQMLSISLLMTLRDRGEDFFLGALNGTALLGLWSVANRLVRIVQETGSSVVSSVATPAFAKMQKEPARLFRAYETSLVTAGSIMFPGLLLLSVTSRDLIPTLLGQQWTQTAAAAQIIALTTAMGVFVYFDRPIFVAVNKVRPEIFLVAFIVVAHLTLVVLVAPHGLTPLAIALFCRTLVTWPIRTVVLHRCTGVPYRSIVRPLRVLLAALLMAGVVQGVMLLMGDANPWLRIATAFAVAALVYPAAMLLVARSVVLQLVGDLRRLRQRKKPVTIDLEEKTGAEITG